MENEENVYKEVYVVFDTFKQMYIRYLNLHESNIYTNKIILAREFETELDAIIECKEKELSCFRVDKVFILEY